MEGAAQGSRRARQRSRAEPMRADERAHVPATCAGLEVVPVSDLEVDRRRVPSGFAPSSTAGAVSSATTDTSNEQRSGLLLAVVVTFWSFIFATSVARMVS